MVEPKRDFKCYTLQVVSRDGKVKTKFHFSSFSSLISKLQDIFCDDYDFEIFVSYVVLED